MEEKGCCGKKIISFLVGVAILWAIWFMTSTSNLPWPVYPTVIWALVLIGCWCKSKFGGCDSSSGSCGCPRPKDQNKR